MDYYGFCMVHLVRFSLYVVECVFFCTECVEGWRNQVSLLVLSQQGRSRTTSALTSSCAAFAVTSLIAAEAACMYYHGCPAVLGTSRSRRSLTRALVAFTGDGGSAFEPRQLGLPDCCCVPSQ